MNERFVDMGKRIKTRRNELNITQLQLAEKIGISNNHLSSIENGKDVPRLENFVRICECLNTRPDYLLLGSISSNNVPQNIIENLQLCSEHDLVLIKHMVDFMVEQNLNNRNLV